PPRRAVRALRPRRPAGQRAAGPAGYAAPPSRLLPLNLELEQREGEDDDEQHEGDRRGGPEAPPAESFFVHVQHHAQRALQGPALCHHIRLGKELEESDGGDDAYEQGCGRELREGDVAAARPPPP